MCTIEEEGRKSGMCVVDKPDRPQVAEHSERPTGANENSGDEQCENTHTYIHTYMYAYSTAKTVFHYRTCRNFRGISISWVIFLWGKIFVVQSTHKNLLSTKILMPLKQNDCGRGNICGSASVHHNQYDMVVGKNRTVKDHLLRNVSRVCTLFLKKGGQLQSNWKSEILS